MKTTKKWNRYEYITYFALGTIMCFYAYFTNQYIFNVLGLVLIGLGIFRKYWLEKRIK